jgi:ankyrin repeat protein
MSECRRLNWLAWMACCALLLGCSEKSEKSEKEALLQAAKEGDVKLLKESLTQIPDPNIWCESGYSPLSYAASQGDSETVRMLLEAGADPGYPNVHSSAWTTTMMAADADCLRIFLEGHRMSPKQALVCVRRAATLHSVTALKAMARNGVDLSEPDMLVVAIWELDPSRHDRDSRDIHLDIVNVLLRAGSRVNGIAFDKDEDPLLAGYAPLHVAALEDNWPVARLLLEHGADPMKRSVRGHTAYELAEERGSERYLRGFAEWAGSKER